VIAATKSAPEREELLKKIQEARSGNIQAREDLIEKHQGFIKALVLKNVTSNEDIINRDEYSVALIAFNEAITSYRPGLLSFQSFAAKVIKRRLVDYRRAADRHTRHVSCLEDFNHSHARLALENNERLLVRMEMEAFVRELARHSFSLRDLIRATPKHLDSGRLCARIAQALVDNPDMRDYFTKYGTIPLHQLCGATGVSPKTVKRHRKYIIALCLILLSGLETMKEYVKALEKGSDVNA